MRLTPGLRRVRHAPLHPHALLPSQLRVRLVLLQEAEQFTEGDLRGQVAA
jgi:hypothetical protein